MPNKGNIEEGRIDFVLKRLKEDFSLLLAENYEKVAQEIIRDYEDRFFPIIKIGRWWDRNEEIDIVALNEEENKILFGEVKWSNKPVGTDIYDNLKEKARKIELKTGKRNEYFYLFSKTGFTEGMIKVAKNERVVLFDKDKIIEL